jgi:hypothetical protein
VLRPGQQAEIIDLKPGSGAGSPDKNPGQMSVLSHVDTAAVMAWKNGLFAFHNADLPTVMRQLARWYNIDVTYEGHIPQEKFQFDGKMGKELTLSEVLDLLTNAQVHYTIEVSNKLVIRP